MGGFGISPRLLAPDTANIIPGSVIASRTRYLAKFTPSIDDFA
jgi:hypothetical protein